MKLVYETATGRAVSIGTVIADPLPAGLTAVDLTTPEAVGLRDGTMRWDTVSKTVVVIPPSIVDTNTATIGQQAHTAYDNNRTFLALATPTNAQVLAQTRALTRQMNGVIRFTAAPDLMADPVID